MKAGTIIRLSDGREGTVVYNGLDGKGIRWGRLNLSEQDVADIMQGDGNTVKTSADMSSGFDLHAEAMLREPYPHAIQEGMECVGEEFEIVSKP